MKRFLAAGAVALALVLPGAASALSAQNGQNVTVPKGETRQGTYYVGAQVITIDGDVDGDLICGGNTVTVNGTVRGDVICAAQTITVNGPVEGSIRAAAQLVNVNGRVGRNVQVAAQSLNMGGSSSVGGDLGVAAQTASINGPVESDVYGAMQSLSIGAVVGAVVATMENFTVSTNGSVRGDLKYTSEQAFTVDKSKVGGQIVHTEPKVTKQQVQDEKARAQYAARFYWMIAGLLVGLTLVWLVPKAMRRASKAMLSRPGPSLGWGLVVTLLGPLVVLALLLTIVGIPLGLLAGVLWVLLLCLSGVFVGVAFGEWLLERADWNKGSLLWAALLGIPLSIILFSIPIVGPLAAFVATIWGVGGMSIAAREAREVHEAKS